MRTSRPVEFVEISVVVKHVTAKAILVNFGVKEEVWIPKSQVDDFCDDTPATEPGYATTSIFIPEWLAKEKGMI